VSSLTHLLTRLNSSLGGITLINIPGFLNRTDALNDFPGGRDAGVPDPLSLEQGCQIFLGATYQNGGIYTQWPQNVPYGHKIYQLALKFIVQMFIKIFQHIPFQNLPKFTQTGIFC
jgi:hypothetical protein